MYKYEVNVNLVSRCHFSSGRQVQWQGGRVKIMEHQAHDWLKPFPASFKTQERKRCALCSTIK